MYELLNKIKLRFDEVSSWTPEIVMPCISSKLGNVENIDITKKLLSSETCNFHIGQSECNVKFDPDEYKGTADFDKLKKDIIEACRCSGFRATTDNRQKRQSRGSQLASFQIICDHNRHSVNSQLSNGKKKIYSTTRPLTEDVRCPFEFRVFCSKEDSCWYILNTVQEKTCHKFHLRMSKEFIESRINSMDPELIGFAENCLSLGLPPSIISNLCHFFFKDKAEFTANQVRFNITSCFFFLTFCTN